MWIYNFTQHNYWIKTKGTWTWILVCHWQLSQRVGLFAPQPSPQFLFRHTWQHPIHHLSPLDFPTSDRTSSLLHATTDHRRVHFRRSTMSSPDASPALLPNTDYSELSNDSDFQKLVSPDYLISICGFGSLLSGTSDYSLMVAVITIVFFICILL